MASDVIRSRTDRPADPDAVATDPRLPLACLLAFLALLAVVLVVGLRSILGADVTATQERHFVFRRLEEPLYLGTGFATWRGSLTAVLLIFAGVLTARLIQVLRQARSE